MKELEDQTILITGSSKGIGKDIAILMGTLKMNVFVHYHNSYEQALEVKKIIEERNGRCTLVKADVSNMEEVQQMFDTILKKTSKIDALVNNVGVLHKGTLISTSEKNWDAVIDINLKSAFMCSKLAARIMMRNRSGNIINIISSITNKQLNIQSCYSASKYGLIGMTKALAKELGLFGIRVNGISPGPIRTCMNPLTEAEVEQIKKDTPLKDITNGTDIANFIAFLLSYQARMITGQVITIDGGLSL